MHDSISDKGIVSASQEGLRHDDSSDEDIEHASTEDMAEDVCSESSSSSDEDIEEMMVTFKDVSSPLIVELKYKFPCSQGCYFVCISLGVWLP